MSNLNRDKQAMVLSGGGADGAYAVGVMKALFAGQSPANGRKPLDPEILTGTSIGAYNAAFLASQWDQYGMAAISSLEQVWLDRLTEDAYRGGNGAFRIRANPLRFLDPRSLVSQPIQLFIQLAEDSTYLAWEGFQRAVHFATAREEPLVQRFLELFDLSSFIARDPLEQTVTETIDFENIRRSTRELRIVATDWVTGQPKIFDKFDMTDQLGPLAILASAAIPGFFPPTDVGAQPLVDGSVVMNTPLKPAVNAGADILHVIYLNPDVKKIPFADMSNTPTTLYRVQLIGWAMAINADIESAARINGEVEARAAISQSLETVRPLAGDAEAGDTDKENLRDAVTEIEYHLKRFSGYRLLTIHRHFPYDDLGGVLGFLNLERDRIADLIQRGFNDAVDHSCDENKCVIVPYTSQEKAELKTGNGQEVNS